MAPWPVWTSGGALTLGARRSRHHADAAVTGASVPSFPVSAKADINRLHKTVTVDTPWEILVQGKLFTKLPEL